ncbi:obg-like ATPase 1 [Enteropsectra breve]|nr:obg-like ATPase 1 [Enteropsectra breve]
MAKKSAENTADTKIPFERPNKSSNLTMGIVGLPNVGKSTLFNRLTQSSVAAENYPFCTIDATTGHVKIEDPRVLVLEDIYKPKRTVHAFLTIVDIAGLVRGASEGQGLGNQFLDNIRNTDGIFLVVRCFDDKDIIHVENDVDPIRDIQIIRDELRMKDKDTLVKTLAKCQKELRGKTGDKKLEKNIKTVERMQAILESKWINEDSYDSDELAFINTLNLLTTKNVVILANIPAKNYKERKCNKHLKAVLDAYKDDVVPVSATFCEESLDEPLPADLVKKIVDKGYSSLRLMNYFTAGKDEVKAWTIRDGMKAPAAGGVIHTDFEKYFMSADVMEYDEFEKHKSEAQMKAAGKYMQKGKDYAVKSGDIMLFKFNAPKGKK